MTGANGQSSVSLINGTVDSEITLEIVPPGIPVSTCGDLSTSVLVATVKVQP
jgi:hypothetical protein